MSHITSPHLTSRSPVESLTVRFVSLLTACNAMQCAYNQLLEQSQNVSPNDVSALVRLSDTGMTTLTLVVCRCRHT